MDKKKYKYENSTVFIVIGVLAMFIVFPPLARVVYPDESVDAVQESRLFLTCTKESEKEGFRVTSTVYYLNDVPQKNSINFFDMKMTGDADTPAAEISPSDEGASEIIVLNRETLNAEEPQQKTIYYELEFFRHLQGVNFVDNRTSYSVEVNADSLSVNEGNEELKNYLLDFNGQLAFYEGIGYSCYSEGS